jgi:hypothetical protein
MPETMTFDDAGGGWQVMTKLIKRIPHSQKLINHINMVNKEKMMLGNVYDERALIQMGIKDPEIIKHYKKEYAQKMKINYARDVKRNKSKHISNSLVPEKKRLKGFVDNTSKEWKLRNLTPRVKFQPLSKITETSKSKPKEKPTGNIETFLKRNYGQILSPRYGDLLKDKYGNSSFREFSTFTRNKTQKRPLSALKMFDTNKIPHNDGSQTVLSRFTDEQLNE